MTREELMQAFDLTLEAFADGDHRRDRRASYAQHLMDLVDATIDSLVEQQTTNKPTKKGGDL